MAKKLNANEEEFIKFAIKKGYLVNKMFVIGLLATIAEKDYEDKFYVIEDGTKFYYKNENNEKILLRDKYEGPLFDTQDTIILKPNDMPNLKKEVETTVGRIVANYVLLVFPFKDKIEYINKEFKISEIENGHIAKLLTDDPNDVKGIPISEYLKFSDATTFISGLSTYISVSGTEKSVVPPEGIKEYKKKVIDELIKKYGEHALEDPKIVAELETKLKDYDSEWLKGDDSEGRLMSGKVKNTARKKLFLSYGAPEGFDNKTHPVLNTLDEGFSTDPKTLAVMFNDARVGSYGRGAETQQGGVVVKMLLRATSDVNILQKDCGSKLGLDVTITEKNKDNCLGRYVIEGGKAKLLDTENIKAYMNKTVKLRSPLFCNEAPNFCTTCMGYGFKDYPKGATLLALGTGGDIVLIALSKFHAVDIKVTELDLKTELG